MILNFIARLQQKPRHTRVIIMWLGVIIFMAGLFIFWISTLSFGQNQNSETQKNQVAEIIPPDMKQNIPSLWDSLKAGISDLMDSEQGSTDVLDEQSQASKDQPKLQIEEPGQEKTDTLPGTLPQ